MILELTDGLRWKETPYYRAIGPFGVRTLVVSGLDSAAVNTGLRVLAAHMFIVASASAESLNKRIVLIYLTFPPYRSG